MLNRNQESMQTTFRFGLDILFDGYLIGANENAFNTLIIKEFLFDGYLIKAKS